MSKKGPIAHVEVKYAGGLTATSRKMYKPLLRMFAAYAGKIKHRVTKIGKTSTGAAFGNYPKIRTPLTKAEREIRIAKAKKNMQGLAIWTSVLDNIKAKRGGRRRQYQRRGGMWKGLTVKAQASGKRVTMNFQRSSLGRDGKKIPNKTKAWFSMIHRGRHAEASHLFQPTDAEFEALKLAYSLNVVPGMIDEIQARQKMVADIKKKFKGDPKLKQMIAAVLKT